MSASEKDYHYLSGKNHPRAKPVYQYSLDGVLIKKWDYGKLAATELGINYSMILQCCKNIYGRRTAGGFIWRYYSIPKLTGKEW